MATTPTAGHPMKLVGWTVDKATIDPDTGVPSPVQSSATDWSGKPVTSALNLPIAATPEFVGLARGESAAYYGDAEFLIASPKKNKQGHPVRVPPRVVYIQNATADYCSRLKASIGQSLEQANIWCFGNSGIVPDGAGFLDMAPFTGRTSQTTTASYSLTNANGDVFASGDYSTDWASVTVDPARWMGRELLVIVLGEYDRWSMQTIGGVGAYQPDPIGHPEIVVYNFSSQLDDKPEVREQINAQLLNTSAAFKRYAVRLIGVFKGCQVSIDVDDPHLVGARAQRDAFDAAVNGTSRSNLDATFAGIDYQGVYFDVPNEDPSGIDDLIDVAAKIETWVREFYAEAFS